MIEVGRQRRRAAPDLERMLLDLRGKGLCMTEPDRWYPEKGGTTKEAKKVCQRCPVREPCLDYAMAAGERYGVWGGLSERERRKLRKEAQAA